MTLDDLALTPKQHAELGNADPTLVNAWLEATGMASGIKNPTGWFLAGLRTGAPPADLDDARQRTAVLKAERLIRNHAGNIPTEVELLETVFGEPELTADVATLERVGRDLSADAEEMLGPTLRAQLAHTRLRGREPVPGTGGPLRDFDTQPLRARMVALWQRTTPAVDAVVVPAPIEAEPVDEPWEFRFSQEPDVEPDLEGAFS